MMIWQYRGYILAVCVIALAIMSWRRGAGPERATALVLLTSALTTWLYRFLGLQPTQGRIIGGYFETDIVYVLIDTMTLAALIAIMMAANRKYPVWIAGFQLTATGMHLVNEIVKQKAPFAYALLNMGPFYFMVLTQALGLWLHVRREKRSGPYPSWRNISAPSPMTKPM